MSLLEAFHQSWLLGGSPMEQPKQAVVQGSKLGQDESCVPPVHFFSPSALTATWALLVTM